VSRRPDRAIVGEGVATEPWIVVERVTGNRRTRLVVAELRTPDDALGATCTQPLLGSEAMSRVIQIRDVPDEVHAALIGAAKVRGLSLTRYMLQEIEHLAKRAQVVHDNAAVARETQARVRGRVGRDSILTVLDEGRGD